MTCRQLGGACDLPFRAETFEEMAELSRQHGQEMFAQGDPDHLKAMEEMKEKMVDPTVFQAWMAATKATFDDLPEDPLEA